MGSHMESTGLSNLEQYLTVIYTTPSLAVAALLTVQNPVRSSENGICWFPLNSGSCPKCVRSWWLVSWIFKKFEYVKMAVISPGTLSCPKLPYEKFKTIKNSIKLKINMELSSLQPGPATLVITR